MVKIGKKEKNDQLYKAILELKDEQECYDFFQDLCTVSELRSMEQRFEVARLLTQGMVYNDILERGTRVFPQDWELAWILGLRYYSDLKSSDPAEQKQLQEIGVSYIEKAMRLPKAPGDLPGLAANLRSKLGQHDLALRSIDARGEGRFLAEVA
jgi:TrpR-related protein YerC/YecD